MQHGSKMLSSVFTRGPHSIPDKASTLHLIIYKIYLNVILPYTSLTYENSSLSLLNWINTLPQDVWRDVRIISNVLYLGTRSSWGVSSCSASLPLEDGATFNPGSENGRILTLWCAPSENQATATLPLSTHYTDWAIPARYLSNLMKI
jgi:hypothetical protein